MYELYYWTTPNGNKPLIFLEEAAADYKLVNINIGAGEQFAPEFLKISPNNRIPALVDHEPADGQEPLSVFESGAILLYLADKHKMFIPQDERGRVEVLEWLMWQMGGLGPMLGQCHHFRGYAPDPIPYAIDRYTNEATRLYNILERRLADKDFICGEYSIADMACFPWTRTMDRQGQDATKFPNVVAWQERIEARPAVAKAYEVVAKVREEITSQIDEEQAKKHLFGQTDTKSPNS